MEASYWLKLEHLFKYQLKIARFNIFCKHIKLNWSEHQHQIFLGIHSKPPTGSMNRVKQFSTILDHVVDIWYSNNVPTLANHFIHHLFEQCSNTTCSNKFSLSANQKYIYLQFNCSSSLTRKFVSFDWRVCQTQSNKNRICSDNWPSCNACILLVKAGTFLQYQLKIARSNIACKRVDGLWPHWLVTGFLNCRPQIESWH